MFDPSDTDKAMRLAGIAIRLANLASQAVENDNKGLRMGRDEKIAIAVAVRDILSITDGYEDL